MQTAAADDAIFLKQFYLDGRFQRRGIGSHVMWALIHEAGRAQQAVTLGVVKTNPARRLYERLGFRVTHEDPFKLYMRREWIGCAYDLTAPSHRQSDQDQRQRACGASRADADRRRRRARLSPLPGILRGQHSQPAHAPGPWPRRGGVSGLVRGDQGVPTVAAVQPLHVATWIELQQQERAAPTVKARLAAIRHLFDWLVTGQVVPVNPAGSVRGPSHVVKVGKTPVLAPDEARALLDSIEVTTIAGLRDRALIALMVLLAAARIRT